MAAVTGLAGERSRVSLAAVAQLEPAELRLRVKVPGQQPCLEDAHSAAAAAFRFSVVVTTSWTSIAVLNVGWICKAFIASGTSNAQINAKNSILCFIDLVHGRA